MTQILYTRLPTTATNILENLKILKGELNTQQNLLPFPHIKQLKQSLHTSIIGIDIENKEIALKILALSEEESHNRLALNSVVSYKENGITYTITKSAVEGIRRFILIMKQHTPAQQLRDIQNISIQAITIEEVDALILSKPYPSPHTPLITSQATTLNKISSYDHESILTTIQAAALKSSTDIRASATTQSTKQESEKSTKTDETHSPKTLTTPQTTKDSTKNLWGTKLLIEAAKYNDTKNLWGAELLTKAAEYNDKQKLWEAELLIEAAESHNTKHFSQATPCGIQLKTQSEIHIPPLRESRHLSTDSGIMSETSPVSPTIPMAAQTDKMELLGTISSCLPPAPISTQSTEKSSASSSINIIHSTDHPGIKLYISLLKELIATDIVDIKNHTLSLVHHTTGGITKNFIRNLKAIRESLTNNLIHAEAAILLSIIPTSNGRQPQLSIAPVALPNNIHILHATLLLSSLALHCTKTVFEKTIELYCINITRKKTQEMQNNYKVYRSIGMAPSALELFVVKRPLIDDPYIPPKATLSKDNLNQLYFQHRILVKESSLLRKESWVDGPSFIENSLAYVCILDSCTGLDIKKHQPSASIQLNWAYNFLANSPSLPNLALITVNTPESFFNIFPNLLMTTYSKSLAIKRKADNTSCINNILLQLELFSLQVAEARKRGTFKTADFILPRITKDQNDDIQLSLISFRLHNSKNYTEPKKAVILKNILTYALTATAYRGPTIIDEQPILATDANKSKNILVNHFYTLYNIGIALHLIACIKEICFSKEEKPIISNNSNTRILDPNIAIQLLEFNWKTIALDKFRQTSVWRNGDYTHCNEKQCLLEHLEKWLDKIQESPKLTTKPALDSATQNSPTENSASENPAINITSYTKTNTPASDDTNSHELRRSKRLRSQATPTEIAVNTKKLKVAN